MMPNGTRIKGFVMAELLVGVLLGILVLLALCQTLTFYWKTSAGITAEINLVKSGRVLAEWLNRDAKSAAAASVAPDGSLNFDFDGGGRTIYSFAGNTVYRDGRALADGLTEAVFALKSVNSRTVATADLAGRGAKLRIEAACSF